ncbi:MAG: hypothetical protein K2L42_06270 [Clostridia bacterium]|nr:hypothetical protein [Clostridia bacterium]
MESEMLALSGTAETVSLQLKFLDIEMSGAEVVSLLDYIHSHKSVLGEGEVILRRVMCAVLTKGRKKEVHYRVNMKAETFAAAIWLSGKFEERLEELFYSILYIPPERIISLDEFRGEVCVVRQCMLKNKKIANRDMFADNRNLCVNEQLDCKFKDGDKCACKKADLDNILWQLQMKHVFKRKNTYFELNF